MPTTISEMQRVRAAVAGQAVDDSNKNHLALGDFGCESSRNPDQGFGDESVGMRYRADAFAGFPAGETRGDTWRDNAHHNLQIYKAGYFRHASGHVLAVARFIRTVAGLVS